VGFLGASESTSGSSNEILIVVLVVGVTLLIFGLIGRYIGRDKGRSSEGFWIGFLLGPIGLIIVALLQPTVEVEASRAQQVSSISREQIQSDTRPCPWCAEQIKPAAVVCRYCGRDVDPLSAPAGWYPDESRPGMSQWWDGSKWTDVWNDEPQTT
jgi:hypothetical protein